MYKSILIDILGTWQQKVGVCFFSATCCIKILCPFNFLPCPASIHIPIFVTSPFFLRPSFSFHCHCCRPERNEETWRSLYDLVKEQAKVKEKGPRKIMCQEIALDGYGYTHEKCVEVFLVVILDLV